MEVVRLTNLGNLTLKNLLELDKTYAENAGLKRRKLARLWGSQEVIDGFQELFSPYHSGEDFFVAKKGDNYFKKDRFLRATSPSSATPELMEAFEQMGLVRVVNEDKPLEDIVADIKRDEFANPAKYIRNATVELTGLCNLKCRHCYRGGSREGEYGLPTEEVKKALEPLLRAGIRHITITGGEPTLRRKDLLEIIDYASQFLELNGVSVEERLQYKYGTPNPTVEDVLKTDRYVNLRKQLMKQLSMSKDKLLAGDWNICNENTPEDVEKFLREHAEWDLEYARKPSDYNLDSVGVLSNGFFDDQRELIRTLKSYGNISMQTSLDSYDEQTTDRNRGRKGVFVHVKNLVEVSKEEGFDLSIQGHNINGRKNGEAKESYNYFNEKVRVLDIEGMLQLGNAVQGDEFETRNTMSSHNYIGGLSLANRHGDGWCKGFTRPDTLHIRPTGNVGNCLYAYAVPDEFGNLHQMSMAEIINGIQDTKVYQMFKDGRIEQYQHELDKSLFPKRFSKSCEPLILTLTYGMIKERLVEQGVENPVQRANEEVARMYKFAK